MDDDREFIYLVDDTTIERDEYYGDWCECPNCTDSVIYNSNYCSDCGVKLRYNDK